MSIMTEFGTASINNCGYYKINSSKEGNRDKLLHRLIFEKENKCTLLSNVIIHHKNGNKTDNNYDNLELLSIPEHMKLHNTGENNPFYGKKLSKEHKKKIKDNHAHICGKNHWNYGKTHNEEICMKMSKSKNTTGYYRVSKVKNKKYKQGYYYEYDYYENKKKKIITSKDLDKLKEKVIQKGLKWEKI